MPFWNFKRVIKNQGENDEGKEVIELRIEGDIVDDDRVWLYEWFEEPCTSPNTFREELKQYEGETLEVIINSYGGDVFAAASIYDDLKRRRGKTMGVVSGKAMSAASVILMGCEYIKMSPTAILMIHDPLTYLGWGSLSDFKQTVNVLETVKDTILNAYELRTKRSRNELSDMMTIEKYMSAQESVKLNFADEVLFTEGQTVLNSGFSFDRGAILNSVKPTIEHLKNLSEMKSKATKNLEIERLELELTLM